MYSLAYKARWDNGILEEGENQICLSPIIDFEGKRVLKHLEVSYHTDRPFSHYKKYLDWVLTQSFMRFAFKHTYRVVPSGFSVTISTVDNYNINYYLGSLIILRHCVEFSDWTSSYWDDRVFNSFLDKPIVRPSNHMVFNKYTPITPEKLSAININKHHGVKLSNGYDRDDVQIKHFFNKTEQERIVH